MKSHIRSRKTIFFNFLVFFDVFYLSKSLKRLSAIKSSQKNKWKRGMENCWPFFLVIFRFGNSYHSSLLLSHSISPNILKFLSIGENITSLNISTMRRIFSFCWKDCINLNVVLVLFVLLEYLKSMEEKKKWNASFVFFLLYWTKTAFTTSTHSCLRCYKFFYKFQW